MIKRLAIFVALFAAAVTLPMVVSPLTAQQQVDRAHQIGGKFMCMCGCSQVLTQCNHVGCTTSTAMLKEVDQAVTRGDSEDSITQAFVQEFGTKVYAEPPAFRLQPGGLEHARRLSRHRPGAGAVRHQPLAQTPGARTSRFRQSVWYFF